MPPKRSPVWALFKADGEGGATCLLCVMPTVLKTTDGATSPLFTHLRNHHGFPEDSVATSAMLSAIAANCAAGQLSITAYGGSSAHN